MNYIIEDNFVLKMFPFANFKTFHGGKNDWTIIKIKTKIIKIIFNVEEETDCGATRWNARFGRCNFPERGGNAGDVFLRAKNRAGRPADRSISQTSMRIWPSAWPCSAPTPPLLSRLIKRDSSMYSFMGRDFLSYWYARRWTQWRRDDREIILPFFPFKILAKNLKLIFLSALFFFSCEWHWFWKWKDEKEFDHWFVLRIRNNRNNRCQDKHVEFDEKIMFIIMNIIVVGWHELTEEKKRNRKMNLSSAKRR